MKYIRYIVLIASILLFFYNLYTVLAYLKDRILPPTAILIVSNATWIVGIILWILIKDIKKTRPIATTIFLGFIIGIVMFPLIIRLNQCALQISYLALISTIIIIVLVQFMQKYVFKLENNLLMGFFVLSLVFGATFWLGSPLAVFFLPTC